MTDLSTPTGRRRLIIEIARRRARAGSGSSLDFLRRRTWSDPDMALDFSSLKTPFVIVGGVATALYMRQRATLDVDILVLQQDAERISQELRAAGCQEAGPLAFGGRMWVTPDGSDLDVLESAERWAEEAIASPQRSPSGLPIIALPYLVLMKLDASRTVDVGDVGRMLGAADDEQRDRVRDVIRRFRSDQLEDVESLIALGNLEYQDG